MAEAIGHRAWIQSHGGEDAIREYYNTEEGRDFYEKFQKQNPEFFSSSDFFTELVTPLAPENDPLMQARRLKKEAEDREREAQRRGRASTVMTSSEGDTSVPYTARRSLLGA